MSVVAGRWLIAAVLITLSPGCVTAPPKLEPGERPAVTATSALNKRADATGSIQTVSGEMFKLSRAPQQGTIALGTLPEGTTRLVKDGADVAIADDGRFIIGFGRDHPPTAVMVAFRGDAPPVSARIVVAPRAWKIEKLSTVPRFSQPEAEFQARRPGELAQIAAARRINARSDGWRQAFMWPARGRISGVFGSQRNYRGEPGAPHSGVDVAGGAGAVVTAPADGVVILAATAPFTLEGNLLMIDHGMGLNSAFLHLSRIQVKVGDVVRQGQPVGAIGMTGRANGPHLHWGMKWNDERVDPATLAGAMR